MKSNRLAFQIDFAEEEEKSEIISLQSTDGSLRFEDRYETFETLGQGAHAVVKIAKRKDTKQMFAVKIVRSSDPEVQINVKRTFINTKCLRHPNICQDIELFINEKMETSYLVMEYCPFPSLESVLKKRKLTEDEIRVIAKQLLQAIHHAHIKGICHRDLKPDNILVDFEEVQTPTFEKPSTLKVVDFGVSRRYQTKGVIQEMVTKTGNIFYCAPEIYTKSQYTQEVDLWAIGVILFQCATQRLPLHCNDEMEFIELLGKPDKWNFQEYLRDAPLPLQNLITQLLEYNPKERICAADALEHPFFRLQSLQDILALVSSQVDLNTVKQANCGRCKSVQMSLQMSHKWDKVVKTIHTTNQSEQVEVALDDLIRDLGNIHTIQRHGDKCNGMIQLMNSLNNSNMIISRIGSKQEILCISMGMGSIDSLSNISINQEKNVSNHTGGDPFSDFGNIQCSQEFATIKMPEKQHQQQNQNGFLQQQLNAKLDSSIDVQQEANNPHQRSNNIITMFEHLGIKEVDELVEDG